MFGKFCIHVLGDFCCGVVYGFGMELCFWVVRRNGAKFGFVGWIVVLGSWEEGVLV